MALLDDQFTEREYFFALKPEIASYFTKVRALGKTIENLKQLKSDDPELVESLRTTLALMQNVPKDLLRSDALSVEISDFIRHLELLLAELLKLATP